MLSGITILYCAFHYSIPARKSISPFCKICDNNEKQADSVREPARSAERRIKGISGMPACAALTCLHTGGLQPAAQGVDADTKFLGSLCARTTLFCHHPDGSGLERLVVPGRRYPFLRLFSISFVPFPFHYNECFLSINSGKGAGSRWPSCRRTRPCAPRPPKVGMRSNAAPSAGLRLRQTPTGLNTARIVRCRCAERKRRNASGKDTSCLRI